MSEVEMYEQEEVAPKRSGVPGWLWFCGGGCLIAVVAVIALVVWGVRVGKDMVDPEKQWPKVEAILPFDQRPPELQLQFGWGLGVDMFVFQDSRGFMAILMQLGNQKERDQMLDPNVEGGLFHMGGRKNLRAGKVTVQGRELELVRFDQQANHGSGGPDVGAGQAALVDVTPPGATRPVLLQLVRTGGQGEVTDEDIRSFLEPFHVGPDR